MVDLDTIVSLSKRRGFVFQSSEIYGGLGSAWDYGPLGVELKRNVKALWWRDNIQLREDMVGIDAAITMHPKVWEASGHAKNFADPFTSCLETDCQRNYRADHVQGLVWNTKWFQAINKIFGSTSAQKNGFAKALQNWAQSDGRKLAPNLIIVKTITTVISAAGDKPIDGAADPRYAAILTELATPGAGIAIPCPNCGGRLAPPKPANLMLTTVLGPVEATGTKVFLRPETAQGIFVNFDNVLQSSRKKLPFGIGQIGKSFRNEITPGNFIFRTREFEQMEIEYFCKPGTQDEHYAKWIESRFDWYVRYGIKKENLRLRVHEKDELAHYARGCTDIEYFFPMGWSELEGIASRGDYDLNQHAKHSGKTLDYFDDETKQKVVPYVVEPAAGVDRGMLAFLCDAYREEQVKEEKRVVLGFHPEMAPVKVAVLPLLKKRDDIVTTARGIAETLRKKWITVYDDTAAIGKLYRRQDEVGTPYCITVDVQTVGDAEKGEAADRKVTVRERDTMDQIRVPIEKLPEIMEIVLTKGWSARPQ